VAQELLDQFDPAESATESIGVVVWSMDEWEADDAIATGAARWSPEVEQVRILSPDKDFGQCLRDRRVIQVDRRQKKEIDEAALRILRGIGPESIPDWLALVGDTADGIPGLPGFGEKTASALLSKYRHIEDIPLDVRSWATPLRGANQLAETLRMQRREALLYRRLATLVEDVPLPEKLEDLRWRGVPRKKFEAWCDAIGATGLKSKPLKWQ
jgi:5'-3' exonuclease